MKFLKELNQENTKFDLLTEIKAYILVFITGGFAGYIYEVLFYLITEGTPINRGFLYGPFLPVYGWGALLMALLLKKVKKHPFLVFFLAAIITGILEYLTGYIMFLIWHKRWWDYTGLFLNIDGYVCMRSVITFAIGGLLLIYVVEPLIRRFLKKASPHLINTGLILFLIIYTIDNYFSKVYRN